MKIAIIHDILIEYGGAERVLDTFLEMYPAADLYTFYYFKKNKVIFNKYNKFNPKSSWLTHLQLLGNLKGYFSFFKPLALIYFRVINLKKYNLVISSSASYGSKAIKTNGKTKQVCYLHMPPKYLYEEKNQMKWIKVFPFNLFLFPLISLLRFFDKKTAQNSDLMIIANSKEVQKRVERYYGRKSIVIYPPIKLPPKSYKKGNGEYFLCFSRLVRNKGFEIAIESANKYKIPLKIIGDGYMQKKYKRMAGPTVKFLGRLNDRDIEIVYAKTKALIYAAIDEDFGMIPVEAMAHGVPVIAYKSGAITETVQDGVTGVIFTKYSIESLKAAIDKFENMKFNREIIINKAKRFSEELFRKRFKEIVSQNT